MPVTPVTPIASPALPKPPLTPEDKVARAKKAAEARWGEKFDWGAAPIEECKARLAELRSEAEKGGLALQARMSSETVRYAECYNPSCLKGPRDAAGNPTRTVLDIASGRFAGYRTRHSEETGLMESAYACSAACYLYLGQNFNHASPYRRDNSAIQTEPDVVINEAAKDILTS